MVEEAPTAGGIPLTAQADSPADDRIAALEAQIGRLLSDPFIGNLMRGGYPRLPFSAGTALPTPAAEYRWCLFGLRQAGATADIWYMCLLAGDGITYNWKQIVSG